MDGPLVRSFIRPSLPPHTSRRDVPVGAHSPPQHEPGSFPLLRAPDPRGSIGIGPPGPGCRCRRATARPPAANQLFRGGGDATPRATPAREGSIMRCGARDRSMDDSRRPRRDSRNGTTHACIHAHHCRYAPTRGHVDVCVRCRLRSTASLRFRTTTTTVRQVLYTVLCRRDRETSDETRGSGGRGPSKHTVGR